MNTRLTLATLAAAVLLPAAALAQVTDTTRRDTTRGRADRPEAQQDSSRNRMDAQGRRNVDAQGRVRAEAGGAVARPRRNLGLTSTQVTMLQQALKDDGCDPGPIDGIVGPRTRRAIACGFQGNDLDGRNLNELFRSLDLQITVEDSLGVDAIMQGGANARARTGRETDANRNRAMDRDVRRDSAAARRDSVGAARDSAAARDTSQSMERPPRR